MDPAKLGPLTIALLLIASLIRPSAAPAQAPSIPELRQAGRYAEALGVAREIAETTRGKRHARAWEREDAGRLVGTLQTIVGLPDSARQELTVADRADPEIARLIQEGAYRRARELTEQQLAARRRYLGEENQETARSRKLLADLASDQLDFDLSVGMQADVLAQRRRILGEKHPEVAESLQGLGYALKNRGAGGDHAKAAAIYRQALDLRREILPPDDPAIATTLFWIADLDRAEFDYDKAIEGFQKVIELRQARLGPGHPEVAIALAHLAYVLEMQGHFDEATAPAGRAAAICRTAPGVPVVDRIFALCTSAYSLAEAGRFAESERLFTEAIRLQEFLRSQGLEDPLRNNHGLMYASRAEVQLLQGKMEEAWASMEKGAGRRILDAIVPPDTSAARLTAGTSDIPDGRFLSLAEVQAALPEGAAYVGWLDEALNSPLRNLPSWSYVILKSGPVRWFRIEAPMEATSRGLRRTTLYDLRDDLWHTADWPFRITDTARSERESRTLYQERFAPLAASLEGVRQIIGLNTSPDMSMVPLEALVDSTGEPLVARYEVSYAPTATCFAWMRRHYTTHRDPRSWRALVIGDPLPLQRKAPGSMSGADSGNSPRVDWEAIAKLPVLPRSREEVEHVAASFRDPRILVREAASADSVRMLASRDEVAKFDVIHFATHVLRLGGYLWESLVLPPRTAVADGDGEELLVGGREIADWHLDADLVTLSACQTIGGGVGSEGIIGLSSIFLMDGARSVLVSHWKVDDEAAMLLMGRFYEDLTGSYEDERLGATGVPLSKPAALREAKMWLRSYRDAAGGRPFAHPAYWAAFVLLGDAVD